MTNQQRHTQTDRQTDRQFTIAIARYVLHVYTRDSRDKSGLGSALVNASDVVLEMS